MIVLPTLRQLQYLVALADQGHFGRAADVCFVTQSTLSGGIKELEDLLQAALVDRTRRRVVFTPLGLEVVERARRLVADAESLTMVARSAQEPLTGELRLGVIPTIAPFFLPAVLPGLRRAYPQLRLYLSEDLSERLCEHLHDGRLDLLLLALPFDCGTIDSEILFNDPFWAAVPEEGTLAQHADICTADLARETLLLLKDGHCLRDHALAACELARSPTAETVAATSLHTLVQMVANGLGVTLLPEMAVKAGLLKGTHLVTRPLRAEHPSRQIGLIWRRGSRRADEFRLLGRELVRLHEATAAEDS